MSARPDARATATEYRLAALTVPLTGAPWALDARREALARFRAMGVPQRRDEYWRFTPPDLVAAKGDAQDVGLLAGLEKAPRLTLGQTDWTLPTGVEALALADALGRDIGWFAEGFGLAEAGAHDPVPRPLASLTTACAEVGAVIRVTGDAGTLVLDHRQVADGALVHSLLRLEAGASLTLIETGTPRQAGITTLEVHLGEGARLHHIRLQDGLASGVNHVIGQLGVRSEYRGFALGAGGRAIRNETVLTMSGREAKAHVAGVWVGQGEVHHDDTAFITHAAPHCESRQVFRSVLGRGSVAAFQGKILVKQIAQKTDGYQISQALLLDDEAQFLGKPELEIYADDVKCSHGSTTGSIDDTALFYLRSRGVPELQARHLLVLAFLESTLDEVEDPDLREMLADRIERLAESHLG
jgi:Fe-S cluster assembly protein SufD